MQNTTVAVINLAMIAWLAHISVEALRQHRRGKDRQRRT